MKTKLDYQNLVAKGYEVEKQLGFIYLVDECVDRENVNTDCVENTPEWWDSLYSASEYAICFRLTELGHNPNSYGFIY